MNIYHKVFILFGVVFVVGGCQNQAERHEPQGPQQVYLAFHREMSSKNFQAALQYLMPEARSTFAQLAARLVKAETRREKSQGEDPLDVYEQRIKLHQWPNLRDIKLLQKDEKQASIQVHMGQCDDKKTESEENDECKTEEVTLRYHNGTWLIEIEFGNQIQKALQK